MNAQDSRRQASKGKKKASTPTSKKDGGPALSPANASSTPPGFAAKLSPKNKEAASQKRLLRHRALFIYRFYVGRVVEVTLKDQTKYSGTLHVIDPDDFTVVLKNTTRLTVDNEPFETCSTFVVQVSLLSHLSTNGLPNYQQEVPDRKPQPPQGFQTDTDISNNSKAHLYGRELQTASSWLDPSLDSGDLEARGGKTSWNQFEVNEKLFGVTNTYDENLYTTKLDKSKISAAQSKAAEKLAREIESQGSQNFHVLEERGNYTQDSIDEEARYSSVARQPKSIEKPLPRSANAYVPPALRKAEDSKPAKTTISPKATSASPKAAPAAPPKAAPASPKAAPPSPKAALASPKAKSPKSAATSPKAKAATPKNADAPAAAPAEAKTGETAPAATPAKKGLNPKAKEFKLNAAATAFVPKFTSAAAPVAPQMYPPQGQYMEEWAMNGYDPNMEDPEMMMHQHPGMPYMNQYGAPMMMQGPPMHHPMGHQMYMDPMAMPYGGYPPAAYNPYQQQMPRAGYDGRKDGNPYAQIGFTCNEKRPVLHMSTILPAIHKGSAVRTSKERPTSNNGGGEHERTLADEYFERICALESEQERVRSEIRQVRSLLSNNLQLREEQHSQSLTSLTHEMDKLQFAFQAKVQSDSMHQEKEKQKHALLFGEVVRLGKSVETIEMHVQKHIATIEQQLATHKNHTQSSTYEALVKAHDDSMEDLRSSVQAVRSAMTQLKSEVDSDRNNRWKADLDKQSQHSRADVTLVNELDMRLQTQVDRMASRLTSDKSELLRVVDEVKDSCRNDLRRLADHIVGVEQLVQNESMAMNRIVQGVATDWEVKFRTLADEMLTEIASRNAVWTQLDDQMRGQWTDLANATRDVTAAVQTRLGELQEVVPLEIQARQKAYDKLKRRVDALAKALGRTVETIANDVKANQTASTVRINTCVATQLELANKLEGLEATWSSRLDVVQRETQAAIHKSVQSESHQRQVSSSELANAVAECRRELMEAIEQYNDRLRKDTTADDLSALFETKIKAVEGALQQTKAKQELAVSELRMTLEAANMQWEINGAVQHCVADLVSQVVDAAASDSVDLVAWNSQQGIEWVVSQMNEELGRQSNALEWAKQELSTAQYSSDQHRLTDIQALQDAYQGISSHVRMMQDTLVTMAWNIEERTSQESVADVLRGCVASVESAVRIDETTAQLEVMLYVSAK
ncbi:unnamed protein product [Aphanomyces euteiches]